MSKHIEKFFILTGLEGLVLLLYLFIIPRDVSTLSFLGYSSSRWILILWFFQGSLAFFWLVLLTRRRIPSISMAGKLLDIWLQNQLSFAAFSFLCLLGFIASIYFGFLSFYLTDQQIKGIFQRILPLDIWIGLICIQTFWLLIIIYWKWHWNILSNSWRQNVRSIWRIMERHKADIICALILFFLVVYLFYPIIFTIGNTINSDFYGHAREAQRIEADKKNDTSYFLYQMLMIAAHQLFPTNSYDILGVIVVLFFIILSSFTLYGLILWTLRDTFKVNSGFLSAFSVVLSLSLMVITPITLFTLPNKNLYYGYTGITTYHNPTIFILQPLALLLFLFTINLLKSPQQGQQHLSYYLTIISIVILGTLAKPNYIICLLPAVFVFTAFKIARKDHFDWKGILFGIVLPSIGLLAWQYLATYTSDHVLKDESGISLMPFQIYLLKDTFQSIGLKFILSILFPLSVYLIYYRKAKKDISFNFAWLSFIIGAFYSYCLVEQGSRFKHNNFAWSGQTTLFILFVAATIFLTKQIGDRRVVRKYDYALIAIFGLHVISGVIWYWLHLLNPLNAWW
ncbi:MAG: hypothetical protein WCI88_04405 [Chloroflexota bacterium]